MSNYKSSTKGELVAIYRLEFYKNQKKWKFSKNDKKIKKQISSKQKLNETYRVEGEEPVVEPPAPLDVAFLETDSDENLKEPARRRWSTLLDLKLEPDTETEDWAVPEESPPRGCWEPAVEQLRSYEQEWEEGGEGGACQEQWGGVDQVYPPERSRLPVFAGWPPRPSPRPAPRPPPPDPNLLQNFLHAGQTAGRQHVVDTLRQQIENTQQNGPNLTYMNQSVGRNMYQNAQPNFKPTLSHNLDQTVYDYEHNLKQIELTGQSKQCAPNLAHFGPNVTGHLGQNMGISGQTCADVGQNIGDYMHNIRVDKTEQCELEKVLELDQMEWEVDGGVCVMEGGGCCGGECVAGAVAAVAEAEGWLQGPLAHFFLEPAAGEALCAARSAGDVSLSSGDSAAFMRGAHARAHSSELDLAGDAPCPCGGASGRQLAHLSSAALRAALRAHARAARRLLAELRLRARAAPWCPSPPSPDASRSSAPTRDVAPEPPGRGRGRRLPAK